MNSRRYCFVALTLVRIHGVLNRELYARVAFIDVSDFSDLAVRW